MIGVTQTGRPAAMLAGGMLSVLLMPAWTSGQPRQLERQVRPGDGFTVVEPASGHVAYTGTRTSPSPMRAQSKAT